jgi:hypothetical protein
MEISISLSGLRRVFCWAMTLLLAGCAPAATPAALPTDTPQPPMDTPTPTIVWFPPTATFTPYPTQATLAPTPDQRPGIGAVIFEDDFSEAGAWRLTSTPAGSVALGRQELTIVISGAKTYLVSIREQPIFTDFYLEITANPNLCSGMDEYGLLLRVSPELDAYRFSLSCDGSVRLDRLYQGQASSPVPWMPSGAVPPGAPSISRLGVWAVGAEMRFFVNDFYQFTVRDPLLPSGGLGVFARTDDDLPLTVNFSDLVVHEVDQ